MPPKKKGVRRFDHHGYYDVFVSDEDRYYEFALGKVIASSFSGFIAGLLVSALVWTVIIQSFYVN